MYPQTINIELPIKPHVNQWPLISSPYRYNVIAAGRRFGKSEAGKIRAIYRAPTQRVWWVSPTYPIGQDVWRDFEYIFRDFPGAYINKSERLILFPTGGRLAVRSADSRLRSAGLDHVVIDEAAFIKPDVWQYVIRPMLLEAKGSADFLSSTNGRNWFHALYTIGLDENQPQWKSWHYTSYDNPLIDPEEIDGIKRTTPERVFQQEYMAAFLEGGGAVFRNVRSQTLLLHDYKPLANRTYVIGVDWGRYHDYTALVVIEVETKRIVEVDRFNLIKWKLQRERLQTLYNKWRPVKILAESNSIGDVQIEALQELNLPVEGFYTSADSKSEIIEAVALALENEELWLYPDETLIDELIGFTMTKMPSGRWAYSAPSGYHDDYVIATALAYHAARAGSSSGIYI